MLRVELNDASRLSDSAYLGLAPFTIIIVNAPNYETFTMGRDSGEAIQIYKLCIRQQRGCGRNVRVHTNNAAGRMSEVLLAL